MTFTLQPLPPTIDLEDPVSSQLPVRQFPSEKNIKLVEDKAQAVLDVRKEFPDSSLADLYDPLTMPPKLVKAHNELDKAVDLCYRSQAFVNETKRIEFLFEFYETYTVGMFKVEKKKKNKIVEGALSTWRWGDYNRMLAIIW